VASFEQALAEAYIVVLVPGDESISRKQIGRVQHEQVDRVFSRGSGSFNAGRQGESR